MLLDLRKFVRENLCLTPAYVNLLFENLCSFLEYLHTFVLSDVADAMAFVISYDALTANAELVSLTEILSFFLWMFDAIVRRLF